MISIGLAVPHTPWVPARVESLRRLLDFVRVDRESAGFDHFYAIFQDRAPNHVWSAQMWTWGAQSEATHFLSLQDDAIVAPDFWEILHAMLEAVPDKVIGLQAPHRAIPALAEEGARWCTTSDGLIGVGYVVPVPLLREFLVWRESSLKPGAIEAITEDTLLSVWAMVTGNRIWHPIPTIVDHDTSLESSYANDSHANRRSLVRWDTFVAVPEERHRDPKQAPFWLRGTRAPDHLGRFYEQTPTIAAKHVIGYLAEHHARDRRDSGMKAMHRIGLTKLRRELERDPEGISVPHVAVAMLRRDARIHADTHSSLLRLQSIPTLLVESERFMLEAERLRYQDVVKARSVMVRQFLQETEAEFLFFLDSDVSFQPRLFLGMLAAARGGKDFVCAPYPSREGIDFKRAAQAGELAEAAAYRYALKLLAPDQFEVERDGTVEIAASGLGCALISRKELQRIYDEPCVSHVFLDRTGPVAVPTKSLFMLQFLESDGEREELLSEDFSFCQLWRREGGKVHLYLGPGSPAAHHGDFAFRGRIEAFGVRHE